MDFRSIPFKYPSSVYDMQPGASFAARSKSPLIGNTSQKPSNKTLTFEEFMNPMNNLKYSSSAVAGVNKSKNSQLLQFKEQAKQKEMMMMKRKNSAMKIQALFRGYKQRKQFKVIWERHQRKQRLIKLKAISGRLKELFAPYVILKALRKWVKIRKLEKQRLMNLFRQYSALFIQKVWRGYKVRKVLKSMLKTRINAKAKIRGLLKGWKTRKILNSGKILKIKSSLKDLIKLNEELKQQGGNNSLYMQVQNQIPLMKSQLSKEFFKLYRTGSYFRYFETDNCEPVVKQVYQNNPRDEVPVKSCEYAEEEVDQVAATPAKTFTNFLRRGQNTKYNPRAASTKQKKPTPEPLTPPPQPETLPKILDDFDVSDKETEDKVEDLLNEDAQEKQKPTHNFLKRKSQTYQPTKLEWKAKTKINCWGESVNFEPKPKLQKKKKDSGLFQESVKSKVRELEMIFEGLSKNHSSVFQFFGVSGRIGGKSHVPQFNPNSAFITQFSEENYQEIFEELQTHYLHLCNEEEM